MSKGHRRFPKGFVWGAAASSYQIEGAVEEDGKGPSIWDVFCKRRGAIFGGQTGDAACDHYHRYREDVALMGDLGLKAYRFSVSWPRVLPRGIGEHNGPGLDFYDRLVDELLRVGVTPYLTLFHWDYPLALYERGGWLARDSAEWFRDYAALLAKRLGDRVANWITINEPQVIAQNAHRDGVHAPGDRLSLKEALWVGHNLLRAHGAAVQAIRTHARKGCQVGYAPVGCVCMPATDSDKDVEAARRHMFAVRGDSLFNNSWWIDPLLKRGYPQDGLALFGSSVPEIHAGDLETMGQRLDFLGLNIYFGHYVSAQPPSTPPQPDRDPGAPLTSMGTPVTPEALYWGPKFFAEQYGVPVVITENGMSCREWVAMDGMVHDPYRIDFVRRHLQHLRRAIDDGADVRGYFHWSLLDNFEWAEGYKERFGLVFVDYATQRRIPKDSARWYRRVIDSSGEAIDEGGY